MSRLTKVIRRICRVLLVAVLFLILIVPQEAYAQTDSSNKPKTWTVLVGGEAEISKQENGLAGAWQFMRYYPETITVNAGDTVVWKLNSAEPHTVTFPKPGEKMPDLIISEGGSKRLIFNPQTIFPSGKDVYDGTELTGSGQLAREEGFPKEYKLTFMTPGVFTYACAFHSKMKGKIIVQKEGFSYPLAQEQIDKQVENFIAKDEKQAKQEESEFKPVERREGPNGTTIHRVPMGYGQGLMSYMRFVPTNIEISEGDTVEWVQEDVEAPHTVTLTSGGEEPELVLTEKQQQGPPKLIINPQLLAGAGGKTYDGTGYFNSGFLWGKNTPLPGPKSYLLTFSKKGEYKYFCALHDEMGMKGTVTVVKNARIPIQATVFIIGALLVGFFIWRRTSIIVL